MKSILIFSVFSFPLVLFAQYIPDLDGKLPSALTGQQENTTGLFNAKVQTNFVQGDGFPVSHDYGFFTPKMGVVTVDLDTDDDLEIVYGSANYLYAKNMDGTDVAGWPVQVSDPIVWAPSIGDIDGDGSEDIIVTAGTTNPNGRIYAFYLNGQIKPGFPFTDAGISPMMPILGDIDNDGDDEIIYSKRVSSSEGYMSVLNGDGTVYTGWPYAMNEYPGSAAAVGDIDNDGTVEIVGESRNKVWVWDANGNVRNGFPYDIDPNDDTYHSYASPLLIDIDNDQQHEIIFAAHAPGGYIGVLKNDGTMYDGWPQTTPNWIYGAPIAADVDGDDMKEIFVAEYAGNDTKIYGFNKDGNILSNFPFGQLSGSANQIVVVDIDADGDYELMVDNNIQYSDTTGEYLAYSLEGDLITNFPLSLQANSSFCQPIFEDVNNDGLAELIGQGNDIVNKVNHTTLWNLDENMESLNIVNPYYQLNKKHDGYLPLSIPTSNEVSKKSYALEVYPNPTNDIINVENISPNATLRVTNLLGDRQQINKINGDVLNVSDLLPGVYFLNVQDKEGSKAITFIKK